MILKADMVLGQVRRK